MKHLTMCVIVLTLISCDSSRVYEDYYELEDAFWAKDSVQRFDFQITDTLQAYNLKATFRNSSSYPYYNVYFQYVLKDSADQILKKELREYNFFDPKTGEPLGSGLGDLFDHTFTLEENYQFQTPGDYALEFQQYMRMDTLPFILSVGARVEFVE